MRTYKKIINKLWFKFKYKRLPLASDGFSIEKVVKQIETVSTLKIKNIFEIGANYAQDAEWARKVLKLRAEDIYVFEANPYIYSKILTLHNFHTFNVAVYNEEKIMEFNCCDLKNNSGISSLLMRKDVEYSNQVKVHSIRMDKFLDSNAVDEIDFLKLDVEGATWEVLEGFGEKINQINSMHIECEHIETWEGEKLWPEIKLFLEEHNFVLVFFELINIRQSDSIWIAADYLKNKE